MFDFRRHWQIPSRRIRSGNHGSYRATCCQRMFRLWIPHWTHEARWTCSADGLIFFSVACTGGEIALLLFAVLFLQLIWLFRQNSLLIWRRSTLKNTISFLSGKKSVPLGCLWGSLVPGGTFGPLRPNPSGFYYKTKTTLKGRFCVDLYTITSD